jgi:hypothetical protein
MLDMSSENGLRASLVGRDRIRYLIYINGRWRWRPTAAMRKAGFRLLTLGRGGPLRDADGTPLPSAEDQARAVALNLEWDRFRRGSAPAPGHTDQRRYPAGTVGAAYQRAMRLREAERKAKGTVWTKEQQSRDDWPRAWKWLEPVFADVDPRTAQPEDFLSVDPSGMPTGLLPIVEEKVSVGERHRVVKVWRALWAKMAAMGLCDADQDPTFLFANRPPQPRQAVWSEGEAVRLVKGAWRLGYRGLAACLAVVWDTQLSPVDGRRLLARQRRKDRTGTYFLVGRAKTGRAAAGTISRRAERVLDAYLASLGAELHGDAPIFRTRGYIPGPNGGRPRAGAPYTKNSLVSDFAAVRKAVFGTEESRQLQDFRRSGTVEAYAGGANDPDVSAKMANTIAASSNLRKTYNPVNLVSVRRADEARRAGRRRLREQTTDESVTVPVRVTLSGSETISAPVANHLKYLGENGGSDGARTRDLRRDRPKRE